MTSAWGGGEGGTPKADDSTDKLRECVRDKGGGAKNPEILRTSFKYGPEGRREPQTMGSRWPPPHCGLLTVPRTVRINIFWS